MHLDRIAELLQPFLESGTRNTGPAALQPIQLRHISTYIDILLRWNSRVNLTSVRNEEEIVSRHFGESLFTARHLFPAPVQGSAGELPEHVHVIDVGSGAGFPGLPIKIWAQDIQLTLIESNQKKVTFLREVVRTLTLIDVDVFAGRAADFQTKQSSADLSPGELCPASSPKGCENIVTLRAVEHFDSILPTAAGLVQPSGRMAVLIGESQIQHIGQLVPSLHWDKAIKLPRSSSRFLLLGRKESK